MNPSLSSLDKEFVNFEKENEAILVDILKTQSNLFKDILTVMKRYYLFLNYITQKTNLDDSHDAIRMLFVKSGTDLFSITNCLENGCINQAYILLRSLLETNATLQFIYQRL